MPILQTQNRERNPEFDACSTKEFAFQYDGTKYYQFTNDGIPMYQERFVVFGQTIQKHEEFRVTDAVLNEHIEQGKTYCDQLNGEMFAMEKGYKNFDLGLLKEYVEGMQSNFDALQQRRNLRFFPDFHYELATLWYFDETENPYSYEPEYAEVKKNKWLNGDGRESLFFWLLRQPLSAFLPYEGLSQGSILSYTSQAAIREWLRSQGQLERAQRLGLSDGMTKNIESLMGTWASYANLSDSILRATTTTRETKRGTSRPKTKK